MEVSEVGVGVWSLVTDWWGGRPEKAEDVLMHAIEAGVNFFDTADSYGNGKGEELLGGKVLGGQRREAVILTKIGYDMYHHEAGGQREIPQDFSRDYLDKALRNSLRRLNRDYVDILMLHNPRMHVIIDEEVMDWMRGGSSGMGTRSP